MKKFALFSLVAVLFSAAGSVSAQNGTDNSEAMPLPPITIYHLEARRSERIVWLMEELGFPYELEFVRGNLGASLALIHEVNPGNPVAPTVVYGDDILVESGAIIEILLRRHAPDQLQPAVDSPDFLWHQIWMHYAEGSLASRMGTDYRVWQLQPTDQRTPLRDIIGTIQYAEDFLGENPYFGGSEFSAADIMMHFPLGYSFLINVVDQDRFPNINEWMERVEARPAYQRMAEISKPDGMPNPPEPLPDSARPSAE